MSSKPRREYDRKGMTIREVAEKTGLAPSTVTRWTSIPRDEWLLEVHSRRELIRSMYVSGYSVQDICKEAEVSRATVYRALEELPDEFRPQKKPQGAKAKLANALA